MDEGILVAICGPDGTGKTTQCRSLCEYLKANGLKANVVKQHTELYYQLQKRVKLHYNRNVEQEKSFREEAFFAAQDRIRQYDKCIFPMLLCSDVVIVDRYVYSTYAYGLARGVEINTMLKENRGLRKADITIYLDCPTPERIRRIKNRGGIIKPEEIDIDFQEELRRSYLNQPWGEDKNYFILDGTKTRDALTKEIALIVLEKIERGKKL